MPINSCEKGKRGERALVKVLQKHFPDREVYRGAPMQAKGGAPLSDVVVEGVNIWWECKTGKRINVKQALAQACHDAGPTGAWPVVAWKEDRRQWMASMRMDDFGGLVYGRGSFEGRAIVTVELVALLEVVGAVE